MVNSVKSEYDDCYGIYRIEVYIGNEETRKERDYIFITNKFLNKINCVECEDDEFLEDARHAAVSHMNRLRAIRNDGKLLYRIIAKIKQYVSNRKEAKKIKKQFNELKKKHLESRNEHISKRSNNSGSKKNGKVNKDKGKSV